MMVASVTVLVESPCQRRTRRAWREPLHRLKTRCTWEEARRSPLRMTPRISISVTRSISWRGGGRADGARRLATIISLDLGAFRARKLDPVSGNRHAKKIKFTPKNFWWPYFFLFTKCYFASTELWQSLHYCTNRLSSLHISSHHCAFCGSLHVKTSPALINLQWIWVNWCGLHAASRITSSVSRGVKMFVGLTGGDLGGMWGRSLPKIWGGGTAHASASPNILRCSVCRMRSKARTE